MIRAHRKGQTARALAFTCAAIAVTGVAVTAAPAASSPGSASVRIKDIDFKPARVTIRRGGSVRWTFLDARTPHNVRSKGTPRFRGSPTKQEGSYRVTFRRPGTYRYVCTLHLNMKGTVVVR
jgi:plastocyanin